MPILGKRKYINEQIEKILNTLEEKGYDVTYIKNKWYDIIPSTQTEDEFENRYETEEVLSSGAILPYRKKVNEVLKMIEDLLQPKAPNEPKDINNYSEISQISTMPSMPTMPNSTSDIKEILRNAILSNKNENQPINQYDFMN